MENLYKRQSDIINAIRFPLIILVVFVHMLAFDEKTVTLDWSMKNVYTFISEMISHNLGRIPVPFFFLFSGYFFFFKAREVNGEFFAVQWKNRFRTLLIPYLFWNSAMIGVIIAKNFLFAHLALAQDEMQSMVAGSSWYELLWGMPVNFPLWYMRDLLCMTVLAPLFYYFFYYTRYYGLLLLFLLYFGGVESGLKGLSTTAILFFGLGAYLGMNKIVLLNHVRRWKNISYIMTLLFLVVCTYYNGTVVQSYLVRFLILFGMIAFFNAIDYLIEKGEGYKLLDLSATVFFVYAIHEIYIINMLKGILMRISMDNYTLMLIGYFIVPCICLVICLALYYLLRKIAPGLLSFVTGGRVHKRYAKN